MIQRMRVGYTGVDWYTGLNFSATDWEHFNMWVRQRLSLSPHLTPGTGRLRNIYILDSTTDGENA